MHTVEKKKSPEKVPVLSVTQPLNNAPLCEAQHEGILTGRRAQHIELYKLHLTCFIQV